MEITSKNVHRKCSVVPGRSLVDLKALSLSLGTEAESSPSNDYFTPSLMALKAGAPDRNIIGFAQSDILVPSQGYLAVRNGDAMLIIDERDDYYVAKPIGKLGIPGKILKTFVKLQPVTPAWEEMASSPTTPMPSPTTNYFSPKSNRKNSSMISLKSTSSKFSTLRRSSIQQKPLYATLGLFGIETNPFEPIPELFGQISAVQLTVVDQIEYIEFKIESHDTPDCHVFRRNQELASLHAQINYEFKNELNRSPLFSLPPLPSPTSDIEKYLIDVDCFIADLVFLNGEIPVQSLLEEFFQTQPIDVSLRQMSKSNASYYSAPRIKSLVLLDPIEPVPPLSPDFVQDEELVSEPESTLPVSQLKIKLEFEGNVFAFYLKDNITYTELENSIFNRIGYLPTIHLRDAHTRRLGILTKELFNIALRNCPNHLYLIVAHPSF